MLQRFRTHHCAGRRLVLLYCGDHDPAGLNISAALRNNLLDVRNVADVDFDPTPVEMIRFGLNADQIESLGLPWIDGLVTGSGENLANPRHPDHFKPYVQDYLAAHGARKVEANALARVPAEAARLVEDAITAFIPRDWPERHEARLEPYRIAAHQAFQRLLTGGAPS
jgi:hypothetical protein